ncbi:MAG TPA: M56 family metallopeptidase, partial [Vicinamibacterales bacterium]
AHEAAHVVRRDAVWLMIAAAVRALGWWQPLNLVAAARLRLAMELSCDERAAAEPRERAALARCLIKVAEWNVRPLNDGAVRATMASRGSALRRRLESLLDDAPRRGNAPWLAVTTVAVPVVCLAPVVTIASLSHVPAAAVRLVRQTPSDAPAVPAVPLTLRADPRAAVRSSKTALATPLPPEARSAKAGPGAAPADRAAVPEIALDAPSEAMPPSMPVVTGFQRAAAPAPAATTLRDAIAAARLPLQPTAARTRTDVPDRERPGPSWIAHIGADTTRPKLDAPKPSQRALSWIAQQPRTDTTRPK